MFEVPLPQGTRFGAISLGLERRVQAGASALPVWVGLLSADGIWNAGGESSTGFLEYANIESLPHPDSPTDSAWLNSSTSLSHSISPADHSDGDLIKWGFGTQGLHYEDIKFLTDFQTAFDQNESFRTSRGVPIAMALVPTNNTQRLFILSSITGAADEQPPQLFVRTRRVIIT